MTYLEHAIRSDAFIFLGAVIVVILILALLTDSSRP
jgi:hypothetical protein